MLKPAVRVNLHASQLCWSVCSMAEHIDDYVQGVIEKASDECDLNHMKRQVCQHTSRMRTVFYIVQCPESDSCCPINWAKNMPWSFDDPQGALRDCKMHLMDSFHNLTEEHADMAVDSAQVESYKHVPNDEQRRPEQKLSKLRRPPMPPEQRLAPRQPPMPPPTFPPQSRSEHTHKQSSSSRQQKQRRTNSRSHSRSRSRSLRGKGKGKTRDKMDGLVNNRQNGSVGAFHGSVGATTVASLQKQIGDVSSKVAALQVADRKSATAPSRFIEIPSRTTIDVPRSTALNLNEALVRAVEASQHMRTTMETFDKAAKQTEELLSKAQHILSNVLGSC